MKDLVIDSILSTSNYTNIGNTGRKCFALYGFDFMVNFICKLKDR